MNTNNHYDVVIIGAGIIGLSVAETLSQLYKNILLIDKEKQFGTHISSRNSEVIHSGFYYPTNSLKAKLCVEGNQMIYNFCDKHNISYNKCGKLIIANGNDEVKELEVIKNKAIINDIKNVEIIDSFEAKKIEPNVICDKSLWVPSAGIMDSHAIMSKLENLSLLNDVSIVYQVEVGNLNFNKNKYYINFTNDDTTITSDIVINSAGLWSAHINNMLDGDYKLEYYKGDYYKTWAVKNINCLVYPIPSTLSLGVHALINMNGEVFFGPNIYKVDSIDYSIDDTYINEFKDSISKILNVNIDDLTPDFSGIRPKIKYEDKFNDFLIEQKNNYPNFINLIGIDSPGLTSCLAIAKYIRSLLL